MKYMTKEWYELNHLAHMHSDKLRIAHVEKIWKTYRDEYKRMFPCPPDFMKTIDKLHDCEIVSAGVVGNDYIIVIIDNLSGDMDGYLKIALKNMVLKKQDFDQQELGWCYEELYPTERGYELHVLLFEYRSDKMYDLIVECDNIEITHMEEYPQSLASFY